MAQDRVAQNRVHIQPVFSHEHCREGVRVDGLNRVRGVSRVPLRENIVFGCDPQNIAHQLDVALRPTCPSESCCSMGNRASS
jgi:hypothetical protein